MLARVMSAAVVGVEAIPVAVEVDVAGGLPGMTIVGLPDASVRESRERVRSAIRNSGFPFPPGHVIVSLAPADVRKSGAAFDLPIALAILIAGRTLPHFASGPVVAGGVSLDGSVPPMRGLLPIAAAARHSDPPMLVFPAANHAEAAIVADLGLCPVSTLADAARAYATPEPQTAPPPVADVIESSADLAEVAGQALARRALEIAAAGGHHLLLSGPPGAGKTMLARRLPGILPPLALDEALEVTTIHSVAGLLPAGRGLVRERPFRAPHHSCSDVALVGGGSHPRPGELSLAHHGVLFLDELPEFSRRTIESLRQPLESGAVTIARAARSVRFPARITLVGAMNPCPCGFAGDRRRVCRCTPQAAARYAARLSGPMRDRFDLFVEVSAVPWRDLTTLVPREDSAAVRLRAVAARARQAERGLGLNATLEGAALHRAAAVDRSGLALIGRAAARGLSARGVGRVLRVARTIADLAGAGAVTAPHVAEALALRRPLATAAEMDR
jgi:magnesium chelatase family protein